MMKQCGVAESLRNQADKGDIAMKLNRTTISLERVLFPILIAILLVLPLTACGGREAPLTVPAGAQAGDLVDMQSCIYETDDIEYTADCGTLVVPENRNDPDSRLIALPVVRVRATGHNPAEPIFWLAGGPGTTNMGFSHLEGLIDNHDIVLVGYRGVDGSSVLDCPKVNQAAKGLGDDLLSAESIANIGDAFTLCLTRLNKQGFDLDGYTIPEVVEDNEAARMALGYGPVNLLSGSFGTRVAQIYAWMHPESIFRSIMISVNPPGHMVWEPSVLDEQIRHDANLCAQDAKCSARTGNLVETVQDAIDNMPRRWLLLKIDPGKVRFMTHFFLWHRGRAASAYDILIAADKGDASGLALMSLMYDMMIPTYMTWGELAIKGVSTDYDPTRDYLAEMNPPGSILGAPMSEFIWGGTQSMDWPVELIPAEWRQVRPSDVETLLVSGNIDATTPAQWATEELLPSLSNGEQVILSEFGHTDDVWGLQPEATVHLLTTFYDSGEVDDSLFAYEPMGFDVGLGFPLMAKAIAGVILLVIAILGLVAWRVVRRISARRGRMAGASSNLESGS
jgi:pimeloyl-ACP methyl ester carboxylesterase